MAGGAFTPQDFSLRGGTGSGHFARILEALGRALPSARVSLAHMVREISADPQLCGVVLITPVAPADETLLAQLRQAAGGMLLVLTSEEVEACP